MREVWPRQPRLWPWKRRRRARKRRLPESAVCKAPRWGPAGGSLHQGEQFGVGLRLELAQATDGVKILHRVRIRGNDLVKPGNLRHAVGHRAPAVLEVSLIG